ncbi:uncharacterized protein Gasu_61900 [Galdieria sulphuraria]|uniref:Uncharacterized protein n=1 Tax=Galdieria sulphuraria TaxID=130081 RepID=M2WQU3_GALSU|nr:uncharacterized protein Gasu_61900 [Galdieria sulphuraria]EME26165.1 hypothetical protein Gasu_61900 [Galdieria sulphuraria]|eukprot:XP_005702685.1 hypothetical protein Gasu_61900 [Galdieria sulphuraria]
MLLLTKYFIFCSFQSLAADGSADATSRLFSLYDLVFLTLCLSVATITVSTGIITSIRRVSSTRCNEDLSKIRTFNFFCMNKKTGQILTAPLRKLSISMLSSGNWMCRSWKIDYAGNHQEATTKVDVFD